MSLVEALILAVIQGLTEFLPVSSSGHLELASAFFNESNIPKESLSYTIVLHAATALSTILVFRKEIMSILSNLFSKGWDDDKAFSLKIVISMIPAVVVGLVWEDQIESLFKQNILLVGSCLIFTAILLFVSERIKGKGHEKISYLESFIIGLSQAVAILPGVSRSGATIATSLMLKVDKDKAARFSFLMVIPLILGKIAKDLMSGELSFQNTNSLNMFLGFMVATITGILACKLMIKIVRKSKLTYFALYCLVVGVVAIITFYVKGS